MISPREDHRFQRWGSWQASVSRPPESGERNEYVFKELWQMSDSEYRAHLDAGIIQ